MTAVWKRVRLLSVADRRLLAEAVVLLAAIRVALRTLPFSILRRFLNRRSLSDVDEAQPSEPAHRIIWAVKAAARRLPGTTCLAEALAVHSMLRRRGYSPDLRLGVRRPGKGTIPLQAHAWVECSGAVVVGSVDDLSEYAVFSPQLVSSATRTVSARDRALGALLKGDDVSWDSLGMTSTELVEICTREDLLGLVYERMGARTGMDGWPPSLRDELAREARGCAGLELARRRELHTVLDALGAAGVRPILLKGTALAYTVYSNPASRPRSDTDLLIRREQVDNVRRILADLGYRPTVYCDGELVFGQFELRKHDEFGVDHALDFHWKISMQSAFADVLAYGELLEAAQPVPALGSHALAPGIAHSLLLACLHPVMHHGNVERALWIYDIHLLASRLSVPEFERFADLAVSRKIAAVCAHGLKRARFWFGTPVPERVVARLRSVPGEPSAEYLRPARRWRHELASNVRGLPRWRDRVRLLREVVFPSPQYMLGSYRFGAGALGRALLPALYVHRGVYGAWKVLAGKK